MKSQADDLGFSFQEFETKSVSDRSNTIPEFENRDIPVFDVNPFSQVDQAEGSDEEEEYRYNKESDMDEHDDDYNSLTMDEMLEMFDAKMEKRFEEYEKQARSFQEQTKKEMHSFF